MKKRDEQLLHRIKALKATAQVMLQEAISIEREIMSECINTPATRKGGLSQEELARVASSWASKRLSKINQ